jgi:NAD+ kinase
MTVLDTRPRIFILGNPEKQEVPEALEELKPFVEKHALLVGCQLGLDTRPIAEAKPEFVVVLGGDGTLLAVARALAANQVSLIGVNFGKLGFLTHFTVNQFMSHFDDVIANGKHISERMMLDVHVVRANGDECYRGPCVNDCVIHAGPPFRVIKMLIELDGRKLTEVAGDGLIICTPTGSTAHNLSAGGPLILSDVDSMVLTPLNPHSLTHTPVVINSASKLVVVAHKVNEGTTALMDGQVPCAIHAGDKVYIQRAPYRCRIVKNPRQSRWHNLVTKLRWGRPPQH